MTLGSTYNIYLHNYIPSGVSSVVHASFQNSYMKALISNVIVFRGGIREVIKFGWVHWGGDHSSRFVSLWKEKRHQELTLLLSGEGTARTPWTELAITLTLHLWSSELWEANVCCLTHQVFVILTWKLKLTKSTVVQVSTAHSKQPTSATYYWTLILHTAATVNSDLDGRSCWWSSLILFSSLE